MSSPWQLLHGDTFALLPTLAPGSIDAIVTDPPYGIRFMGQAWDGADIVKQAETRGTQRQPPNKDGSVRAGPRKTAAESAGTYDRSSGANRSFQRWTEEWARLAFAALKPGGHLVSFASTRTYHRMTSGIEDAGFEIRDQLAWVFGSGFPKSHNLTGPHAGWGTALKPAWEPIVLARKPLAGTVAANVLTHGTGALNIDGCRIPVDPVADASQLRDMTRGLRATDDGWGMHTVNAGPSPVVRADGRWPANLAHDGSPEVVALFPEEAGASAPVTGDEPSDLFGHGICSPRARVPGPFHADSGSAARFFYCPKTSRAERDAGCEEFQKKPLNWSSGEKNPGSFQSEGTDKSARNNHPTVKPTALMRWLVRLITPPGGHVLDPFNGSGSTGVACLLEGMRYTGIEREAAYVAIARARLTEAAGPLFSQSSPP